MKFLLILFVAIPLHGADLLSAVAMVESGGNHLAIGRAGERGQFQMTRTAWNEVNRRIALGTILIPSPLPEYVFQIKMDSRPLVGPKKWHPVSGSNPHLTPKPFLAASDPYFSRIWAGLYLGVLEDQFRSRFGRFPRTWELAECWNRGVKGFSRNPKQSNYGKRVMNLMELK